jgi:serine/threonine-protein kinase RsbW
MESTEVSLTFPAAAEHIRLARLVASGLATQAGFGIDEIEDLRIGVDELCSLLVQHADPASKMTLDFRVEDAAVFLRAVAPPADPNAGLATDQLTVLILKAAVDHHDVAADRDLLTVELVKRRASASD